MMNEAASINDDRQKMMKAQKERLDTAVHYGVGQICDQVGQSETDNDDIVPFSKVAIAQLTDWLSSIVKDQWTNDLTAFALHAKRNVINGDDVKLLCRRNDSLLDHLNRCAAPLEAAANARRASAAEKRKEKTKQPAIKPAVVPKQSPITKYACSTAVNSDAPGSSNVRSSPFPSPIVLPKQSPITKYTRSTAVNCDSPGPSGISNVQRSPSLSPILLLASPNNQTKSSANSKTSAKRAILNSPPKRPINNEKKRPLQTPVNSNKRSSVLTPVVYSGNKKKRTRMSFDSVDSDNLFG